jgi:hypothetical protein
MSNYLIDEDTELLAAEFVLGTLDSEERANAQSLLRTDHGFIAMVRIWERRFGELHLMVEPVDPDAKIFERIKVKIAELAPGGLASDGKSAPDGKSAVEASPQPPAATGSPGDAEPPKPAETLPSGEVPKPADGSATAAVDGTAPKPQDVPASEAMTTDEAKPPEAPLAPSPVLPGAAAESGLLAKDAIPVVPSIPPAPLGPPDKTPDKVAGRPARSPEITVDVIRSRDRWRLLGVCMIVLVAGLTALLAAWRFIPDRLPARLRPAQLMTALGIQAIPGAGPTVRPASPDSGFDE